MRYYICNICMRYNKKLKLTYLIINRINNSLLQEYHRKILIIKLFTSESYPSYQRHHLGDMYQLEARLKLKRSVANMRHIFIT